jgi:hypothetical protein
MSKELQINKQDDASVVMAQFLAAASYSAEQTSQAIVAKDTSLDMAVDAPLNGRTDRQKMKSFAKAAQSYGSTPNALGSKHKAPVAPNQPQNSAPAPSLPEPVLPNSGSTAPYNFPKDGSTVGLKGLKDYYSQLLLYIHAHPTDITAMQHLMDFLTKISAMYNGNIPADVRAVLDCGSDGATAMDGILSIIPKLEQYAFFTGFSVNGKVINGEAGMKAYIDAMRAALAGVSHSPYTDAMTAALASDSTIDAYAKLHTEAGTGRLFYKVTLPNPMLGTQYSKTYYWDEASSDPNDLMTSQYFILTQVTGRGPDLLNEGFNTDPFTIALDKDSNQIETNYRQNALQDLLAKYKDPLMAISIWIMTSFDNQYQLSESGLNDTTDTLTNMTNSIATRLSTLAQDIGFTGYDPVTGLPTGQKMTPEEAQEFADTLANGTGLMNGLFQLNGLSSEWNKNVFQDLCSTPLTNPTNPVKGGACFTGPFPKTVGELLFGVKADGSPMYTAEQKATYLSTLNMGPPPANSGPFDPTKPGTPSEPPAESQGYQQLVGDLQQAGSFITGRSKVVTQELTQTTDLDSSALKAFSTMLQDLEQMILKGPIAGQKTS